MNERIRELAEKAGYNGHYATEEFDVDEFAELIVRECVKEIEFQYGGGSDQPMDNEWDRAIECVSSMVKYRFGVEEQTIEQDQVPLPKNREQAMAMLRVATFYLDTQK